MLCKLQPSTPTRAEVSRDAAVAAARVSKELARQMSTLDTSTALLSRWREAAAQTSPDYAAAGGAAPHDLDEALLFRRSDFVAMRCCELREVLGLLLHANTGVTANLAMCGDGTAAVLRERIAALPGKLSLSLSGGSHCCVDIFDPAALPRWKGMIPDLHRTLRLLLRAPVCTRGSRVHLSHQPLCLAHLPCQPAPLHVLCA